MGENTAAQGFGWFFMVLNVLLLFVFGGYLFVNRRDRLVQARSWVLEVIYWIFILAITFRTFFGILSATSNGFFTCSAKVWVLGTLVRNHPIANYKRYNKLTTAGTCVDRCHWTRAVRLLLIFNYTQFRLTLSEDQKDAKPSFWRNPMLFKNPWMLFLWWLIPCVILWCIPLLITIYSLGKYGKIDDSICVTASNFASILSFAIMLVALIVIGIKIRKVHDAFFIKQDLKILAINCIVVAIPAIVISSGGSKNGVWGNVIFGLVNTICITSSFIIPSYLVWQNNRDSSHSGSLSSTDMESATISNSTDMATQPTYVAFKSEKKYSKLMSNELVFPFVDEYILHFQLVEASSAYLLWRNLCKWKLEQTSAKLGKAFLIYRKYVAADAYIHVGCIPDAERTRVGDFLNKSMDDVGNGASVDDTKIETIYDDILQQLESELLEKVLHGFVESKYYSEYQSKYMLNDALIPTTTTSV